MRNRRQAAIARIHATQDAQLSDYTYDQVFEAAAIFTLSPSDIRHVDVRTVAARQRDAVVAFGVRRARLEVEGQP